jgi:hypothetical protein
MAETEVDNPETQRVPKKAGSGKRSGARASIQVSDIPLETDKAADMMAAASGEGRRRGGSAGGTVDAQKFSRAIRDANNKIIATRSAPPAMQDGTPLGDTYEIMTHEAQSEAEIKRDIQEARGGRKWILRVYDSNDNIIASKSLEVGGVPQLDPLMMGLDQGQEDGPMQPEQQELTEEEILEQTLARDPEIIKARKNLRLKQLQNDQEEEEAKSAEMRARRVAAERAAKGDSENGTNGNGKHKHRDDEDESDSKIMKAIELATAPLKAANERMERELAEEKRRTADKESKSERRAELEAMMAPLKAAQESTQKHLEAMLQKMNTPAPPTGPTTDTILAKLESLKTEIKSDTKDQIGAVMTSLTEKINTVATTLNTFMAKGSDPATQALIALATNGGKGGTAEKDPFHGLERALTVMQSLRGLTSPESSGPPDFPSFLVEKMAETTPEVLNFFREQRGAVPTKEDIDKMMRAAAMNMYTGLDEQMKKSLNEGFARLRGNQALPAAGPTPTATPASEVSVSAGAPSPQPGIVAFPGAAPAPAGSPSPAAPPPGTVLTPAQLFQSLDEKSRAEYAKRVNWILGGMLSEMKLGVREMAWPQKAHGNLPKPIIDQIVEVASDTDVHNIVKPYADPAITSQIWAYLAPSNPQSEWYQEWLAQGINWIKQAEGVELVEPTGEEPVTEDTPG